MKSIINALKKEGKPSLRPLPHLHLRRHLRRHLRLLSNFSHRVRRAARVNLASSRRLMEPTSSRVFVSSAVWVFLSPLLGRLYLG